MIAEIKFIPWQYPNYGNAYAIAFKIEPIFVVNYLTFLLLGKVLFKSKSICLS